MYLLRVRQCCEGFQRERGGKAVWQPPDGAASSAQWPDVGRRRVRRLMAKMGLTPIYQRPRTSDPHPSAPDLSILAAQADDRAVEPRVVRRYDIHLHAWGLPLPRGDHGLGGPQGAGLAPVEHNGCRLLRRGAGRDTGPVRQAGNLQRGSGQPAYFASLHKRAARGRRIAIRMTAPEICFLRVTSRKAGQNLDFYLE